MDKAVLLLSQYCDNDLSTDEQVEFENWLKADPAHVDRFARATLMHSLLYDLTKEQNLQSTAWSHALKDSDPYIPVQTAKSTSLPRGKQVWMLAAAAVLLGVLASVAILPSFKSPELVAQVTSLQGSVVTSSGQTVLVGTLLPEGESLQVKDGSVLVTFECGAKTFIEGPAEFVVDNARAGSLVQGMVSTRVPTQAIGFAIHTPLLRVVDLGTEFQVKIVKHDQIDLHVFDGSVEVHLIKKFKHANNSPLEISEGRSERFDLGANEIIRLDYDETLKREF